MKHAAAPRNRTIWVFFLVLWCLFAAIHGVRILAGSGTVLSNSGSLALAIGSAFITLTQLDRNALRRRVWLSFAIALVAVSGIILWLLVSQS